MPKVKITITSEHKDVNSSLYKFYLEIKDKTFVTQEEFINLIATICCYTACLIEVEDNIFIIELVNDYLD